MWIHWIWIEFKNGWAVEVKTEWWCINRGSNWLRSRNGLRKRKIEFGKVSKVMERVSPVVQNMVNTWSTRPGQAMPSSKDITPSEDLCIHAPDHFIIVKLEHDWLIGTGIHVCWKNERIWLAEQFERNNIHLFSSPAVYCPSLFLAVPFDFVAAQRNTNIKSLIKDCKVYSHSKLAAKHRSLSKQCLCCDPLPRQILWSTKKF